MTGKWMLARNGRHHWFRKGSGISVCGSMSFDRCLHESEPVKGDWPCTTCKRTAPAKKKKAKPEQPKSVTRDERIGNELKEIAKVIPQNSAANTNVVKRLHKAADELLKGDKR